MNLFRYKIMEPSGHVSTGIIKLPYQDTMSAASHLERDGSMTIYVKKLDPFFSFLFKLSTLGTRTKISKPIQAELLNNLYMMLRSGISLTTALKEEAEGTEIPQLAGDLQDIIISIQGGSTFSEAARQYAYIFPPTIIHLIRIGEETGQLEKMLKDSSDHIRKLHTIMSDTKQALLYPIFVIFAVAASMGIWFYYVVPKILSLFKEMNVALPPLTVWVMKISYFLQDYFLQIFLALIGIVAAIILLRQKSMKFKFITDAILLDMPIAGTIISASNLAFLTEYFSLLINAGIDLLRSVSILKDSLKNEVYKEKLGEVREFLTRGESISEAFEHALVFPALVVRMLRIGETAGTLPEQLDYVADDFRTRLNLLVSTMGKMIEPIVLIVAGTMFAIIIGALMLPIYDLISQISA